MTTAADVPFQRLIRVQTKILWTQRAMIVGAGAAGLLGIGSAVLAVRMKSGPNMGDALGQRFSYLVEFCVLLWLALGAVAGAAPFRANWSSLVLALAPRRTWWLGACYVSMLIWTLATVAVFTLMAGLAMVVTLAIDGSPTSAAFGAAGELWHVLAGAVIEATIGFFLGAAIRSTAIALVACYVVIPTVAGQAGAVRPWIDLDMARSAVSQLTMPQYGPIPVIFALLLWLAGPAVLAALRLRRAVVE